MHLWTALLTHGHGCIEAADLPRWTCARLASSPCSHQIFFLQACAGGKGLIMLCEAGGTLKPSVNFPFGKVELVWNSLALVLAVCTCAPTIRKN